MGLQRLLSLGTAAGLEVRWIDSSNPITMLEPDSPIHPCDGGMVCRPLDQNSAFPLDPSLKDIHRAHLDKLSDKWELYLDVYDDLFQARRHQVTNLLEIGIQNGGSLECWSQYFPNISTLVGVDIDINCANLRYSHPSIHVIVGDACDQAICRRVGSLSQYYDIVIDDGSHTSSDIIKGFFLYFRLLAPGGIYVAEDLHCSYWSSFEGGLNDPFSSIAFFKRLVDLINRHHWGLSDVSTLDVLHSFAQHYAITLEQTDLDWIHEIKSVRFEDSMCIVRKRDSRFGEPLLGRRLIGGTAEGVVSGHDELQFDFCGTPNQDDTFIDFPEHQFLAEQSTFADLKAIIASHEQQITSLHQQLITHQGEPSEAESLRSEISNYYHLLRSSQISEAQTKDKLRWNRTALEKTAKLQQIRQHYEKRLRQLLLRVSTV